MAMTPNQNNTLIGGMRNSSSSTMLGMGASRVGDNSNTRKPV